MTNANLTQAEADALLAMEKHRADDLGWDYPDLGGQITIPLVSNDRREPFLLDVRRGRIDLAKGTYQNRGRQVGLPGSARSLLESRRLVADAPRIHAILQHRRTTLYQARSIHMMQDIQALVEQYSVWLKDRTSLREVEDSVEITTPYLDRHNDYLQIYAKRANGGFVLTDDGYVIDDLELSGCKIDSPKRQAMFNATLNGFGVQANGKALEVKASASNFSLRKHNLVQAMLAVNDLFYLASPTVASLFQEDVAAWLDLSAIRYTPSVKFTGKSGYDHRFDFVIPKSTDQPERVIRAINRPGRDTTQAMAFSWIDTREARSPEARAYAILNDSKKNISENIWDAMHNYKVNPVPWSARDEARAELAA